MNSVGMPFYNKWDQTANSKISRENQKVKKENWVTDAKKSFETLK